MDADYIWTEYVSLENVSDWTSYCTHHIDMDTPQNVHVDVLSDFPYVWKFYYTHHREMDTSQYVHLDVPSGYFYQWMFYDKYHSNMDAPQYV